MKQPRCSHYILRSQLILIVMILYFFGFPERIAADEEKTNSRAEPIQIISDDAFIDPNKNRAVFRGNARAAQGQTNITADQITIFLSKSKEKRANPSPQGFEDVERIVAEGQVRIVFDQYIAESEKVIYMSADRKLILSGPGSKITSDKEEIIANEITYFRDSGRIEFTGSQGNQVKATVRTNERVLN